ncbi:hypothetical protein BDN72DRAFT_897528 [Pluteus cervinus]|uniref:Uncharacterized protein n=1 Tax=Pluteus cervinus TaxID=181527 RepID=A0ACD3AV37_9AGAR|nr:hypothetical protein BDN72DRAFT_897528 [Pluteus cervinus]
MTSGKSKGVYYVPSQSDGENPAISDTEDDHFPGTSPSRVPATTTTPSSPVAHLEINLNLMTVANPGTPNRRRGLSTASPSQPRRQAAAAPARPTYRAAAAPARPTHQDLIAARPPRAKPLHLRWYAIARGRSTGIIQNWVFAEPFVKKRLANGSWGNLHPNSSVVAFDEMVDAMEYMVAASAAGEVYSIDIEDDE